MKASPSLAETPVSSGPPNVELVPVAVNNAPSGISGHSGIPGLSGTPGSSSPYNHLCYSLADSFELLMIYLNVSLAVHEANLQQDCCLSCLVKEV